MSNIVLNKVSATCPIYDVTSASILHQGYLAVLGAQDMATNIGTYVVTAPAAITDLNMVLIASVPLNYEAEKVEGDFSLAVGGIGRAYQPYIGMVITIEDAQITGATTKDQYVIPAAGAFKMAAAAALGGTEAVAFQVKEKTTINGVAASKLLCIKA
jgi:hypothetical protein